MIKLGYTCLSVHCQRDAVSSDRKYCERHIPTNSDQQSNNEDDINISVNPIEHEQRMDIPEPNKPKRD